MSLNLNVNRHPCDFLSVKSIECADRKVWASFFYTKTYLREVLFPSLMPTFKHRDRLTILAEILKTTSESKEGKTKIDIIKSANLSYAQANKFLSFLLTGGFLRLDTESRYKPTKKGLEFAKNLESLNLRLES